MLNSLSRAEQRVLVVLLTGARNLNRQTIKDLAQVHSFQLTSLLDKLERNRLAEARWGTYSELWALTDAGRARALDALGLVAHEPA